MDKWNAYYKTLPALPTYLDNVQMPVLDLLPDWQVIDLDQGCKKYLAEIEIPEEFKGHQVLLRMDSVGCEASIKVEGNLIRQHFGSYTQWDCDITAVSDGKKSVSLEMVLKDRSGELNPYDSAGVFRGIKLIALPMVYIDKLYTHTQLISKDEYALSIHYKVAGIKSNRSYTLKASLYDASNNCAFTKLLDAKNQQVDILCKEIDEWDSEHPYLYKLTLSLKEEGKLLEKVEQDVGFRSVIKNKNQILWNGKPLKLRGINYREPLAHESYNDIARDLNLFKQANINYIRGLYYPFSTEFLSLCDKLGFYVEDVAPIVEVGQEIASTQNAPEYREDYLGQIAEMVDNGRSHVSVLIWCLGNDSTWGVNFRKAYQMVKEIDDARIINFNYPMTIPDEEDQMDVWAATHVSYKLPLDKHYDHMVIGHTHGSDNPIGYQTGSALGYDTPVLHTAYAHLPCYNRDQIQRDPGIHEFWGKSIKRFWEKMLETEGALGGAVMAGVDENGEFSSKLKNFNWGILDANHQPKPEYHHLKMAYSPTRFSDVQINNGEDTKGKVALGKNSYGQYCLVENDKQIIISNNVYHFEFSKESALMTLGKSKDKKIIKNGPFLQTTRLKLEPWVGKRISTRLSKEFATVYIEGDYGKVCSVKFQLIIFNNGEMETSCKVLSLSKPMPHTVKAIIGLDCGGLDELGICYSLESGFDTLKWKRQGLWPTYPKDHIGRPEGYTDQANHDDFYSMKHEIIEAQVIRSSDRAGIQVISNGSHSLRLEKEDDPNYVINDRDSSIRYDGSWYQMDDYCGNYKDTETLSKTPGDYMEYKFHGTGISVYGPLDILYGKFDVYIDGELAAENISQYPEKVDFSGMSRGYEKRYRILLFSKQALENKPHTIRIVVKGEREIGAQENYVSLDYFVVEAPEKQDTIKMIVNNDYNYTRLVRGNYMREKVDLHALDELKSCIRLLQEKDVNKNVSSKT